MFINLFSDTYDYSNCKTKEEVQEKCRHYSRILWSTNTNEGIGFKMREDAEIIDCARKRLEQLGLYQDPDYDFRVEED